MMHIRLLVLLLIAFVTSCNKNAITQNTSLEPEEKQDLDSIYTHFEEVAYNHPEQYISNPDSFLNTVKIKPNTVFQKELYAYGLIFIGYALLESGDIFESVKFYESAYDIIKKDSIQIENIEESIVKPLSNLYTRINDTEKAINLLENTIKNTTNKNQLPGLYNNLANAYFYNNQIDKAEILLLKTVLETENSYIQALLYNSLANLYAEKNDLQKSIKYNKLALKGFENKPLHQDTLIWYISALGLQAKLTNQLAPSQKALQMISKYYPNTQNRVKAKLTAIETDILQGTSNPPLLTRYNYIIQLFTAEKKQNTLDYTYTKALLGKAKYFKNHSFIDSALKYYELGIENDFKTQQLITSPKDQIRNNLYNKKIIEELIDFIVTNDSLKNNPKIIKQLLWCIELSKARLLINEINRSDQWTVANSHTKAAIHKIQRLYQQQDETSDNNKKKQIQKQIDQVMLEFELSEKYFETIRYKPNKEHFIKTLDRPNTTFYSYFIHNNKRISLIQLAKGKIYFHQIIDTNFIDTINKFKNDYFGTSPNVYNNSPLTYRKRSQNIREKMLPNLIEKNVFISLDGDLYGLPFDALYAKELLVKEHNFAYLNSFLLFNILQAPAKNTYAITVMYRAEYQRPLPSLTFVNEEVANISNKYLASKIDIQDQTDDILTEQFAKSNVIHIAAHTILDSSAAPIIYLKNPISTNQIRYFDIKSPLVFLSACNTGTGESLPSEGTESIQRVFLSKNVPSVLSTYWFANDQAMLDITANFYHALYQSQDPIGALADAKRSFLSRASIQQQNPWYWANINYTGIGNNIGLKKASPNLYLALCIGITAMITLIIKKRSWINNSFKKIFKKPNNKF